MTLTKWCAAWGLLVITGGVAAAQAPQRTTHASPADKGPQRTMGAGAGRHAEGPANASGASGVSEAVASYRRAWDRMGPAQRKMILDGGGVTPEQYEQMVRQSMEPPGNAFAGHAAPGAPAGASPVPRTASGPDHARGVSSDALRIISRSGEDLNAIRDGNLGRVQQDHCPPEVASRIADLKGRLASREAALRSDGAPAAASQTPRAEPVKPGASPAAANLADDWFRRPATASGGVAASGHQLDDVLGSTGAAAPRTPSRVPDAPERRKEIEQEMAQLRVELGRLLGACPGVR